MRVTVEVAAAASLAELARPANLGRQHCLGPCARRSTARSPWFSPPACVLGRVPQIWVPPNGLKHPQNQLH